MTTARKFGLDFVGEIPWGTHLCQFYETKHDLIDILVPYFAEGLKNNEACMWVTSEPLEEAEAAAALEKVVPDMTQFIKNGQLFILPYTQVHMKGGTFDKDRVIQWWLDKEQEALNRGFEGLRLAGNTFWIEQDLWDAFTDYEETVNDALEGHRVIAVCPYTFPSCRGSDVTDVIKNHGGTIIKRGEKWSVVEDVMHRKEAEVALQRAHDELEQKVEERTQELQAEIEERKRAEENVERLAKFPEENPNPVMRLNAEGEILYANKPAQTLLGDWDGTAEGTAPQSLREATIEALSDQVNKTIEVEVRSRVYDFFVAPIIDAGYVNFYGRDVTEQKRAEESVALSEQKYRELVEDSNSIIIEVYTDGTIAFMNEFGLRFFGYTADELIGRNLMGTIVPEVESTGRDLRVMVDDVLSAPDNYQKNVNENIKKDGSRVWILWATVRSPMLTGGSSAAGRLVTISPR